MRESLYRRRRFRNGWTPTWCVCHVASMTYILTWGMAKCSWSSSKYSPENAW